MTTSNKIKCASYLIEPNQIRLCHTGEFSCYTFKKSPYEQIIKWYGKDNFLWLKRNPHIEAWECLVLKFKYPDQEEYSTLRVGDIRTVLINSIFDIKIDP